MAELILGLILGAIAGGALAGPGTPYHEEEVLIEECQSELPRDKYCEVIMTAKVVDNA